jgi:hypothetical protein
MDHVRTLPTLPEFSIASAREMRRPRECQACPILPAEVGRGGLGSKDLLPLTTQTSRENQRDRGDRSLLGDFGRQLRQAGHHDVPVGGREHAIAGRFDHNAGANRARLVFELQFDMSEGVSKAFDASPGYR